jgi:hypothetical protein
MLEPALGQSEVVLRMEFCFWPSTKSRDPAHGRA